jgi:murein L,D-transpeptidase YcbB/YkuD
MRTVRTVLAGIAIAGAACLTAAAPAHAAPGVGWVGWGETNDHDAVWCVQEAIDYSRANAGLNTPKLALDGIFGQHTNDGIVAFQKWMGIPADGVVGPQTGFYIVGADRSAGHPGCYDSVPTP